MLTEEAVEFLSMNKIIDYKVNPDGTIDVAGNVRIITLQSELPVKFRYVTGYFDCDFCNLTSLEGASSCVESYFSCQNNHLTSLEGAPSYVGSSFFCDSNKLTSLHDIHKLVKEINGEFQCTNNPINDSVLGLFLTKGIKFITLDNYKVQEIINKYLRQGRTGVIGAQQELLDAELDEYARL